MWTVVALSLIGFALTGCGSRQSASVRVAPALSVEDQPLSISVIGPEADERVTLQLPSTDANHVVFVARDSYRADAQRRVDLAKVAPLAGGSYTGVFPMGLVASMLPEKAPAFTYYDWSGETSQRFVLTVSEKNRQLAQTTFRRRLRSGVFLDRSLSVARDGINGNYSTPKGAHKQPAVLIFGGSEGGNAGDGFAQLLAGHGIPTLQIGYFHGTGLPDRLVDIKLEYFARALRWLARQPQVDPHRISVVGISYGSEVALLLGVHYPMLVGQVAALVPSSVVTCGILGANRQPASGKSFCLGSPWSLNGKPLPYTKLINSPAAWDQPKAVIPVEQIHGRVFLVCGGADEEWSSCPYAHAIVTRRRHHDETTTLFDYPLASHAVGTPYIDSPGIFANLVNPVTELDREHYYPKLISFLRS